MNFMVSTNNKALSDTQKQKKEQKPIITSLYKRAREEGAENYKTTRKQSKHLPVITLNVREINAPTKRHRAAVPNGLKKCTCSLQETHFRLRDVHRQSEEMKKGISYKCNKQLGQQQSYQTKVLK